MGRSWALRVVVTALLAVGPIACDDDGPTSLDELPDDLIVTWFATSLRAGGTELLDDGMRLSMTFTSDGTYQFNAFRDRTGFVCDPGVWDCVVDGAFDASTTEVVFDPGGDEARLSATLTPTSLRLVGDADGLPVDLTFVLPPYADLVGTWASTSLLDSIGEIEEGGSRTTLVVTFEADGSYSFSSSHSPPDLFCDFAVSCLGQGSYVADPDLAELRFDPSEPDALTMQLSVDPAQLMLSGFVDGAMQDWTFSKLEVISPGTDGSWLAVSLEFGGTNLIDADAVHQLTFNGTLFSSVTLADAPGPFFCGPDDIAPECSSVGTFTADLDALDFLDGLAMGPQSLSLATTPTSLRLTGTVRGNSADFLYARVPGF